jgi:nucleotide-binding universal stress UspA family protein
MTDDTSEQRSGPLGEPIILVGVDASGESRDALRWAARYAVLVGDRLEVVHAWSASQEFVWLPEVAPPPSAMDVARDGLAEMVDDVLGADSQVATSVDVVEGHASKVLVERSRHAELLVVGSRGRGGFDGMTLGSVSGHCAEHAHCSVMIVRPSTESEMSSGS